jgi:hypothetical protein
VAELRAKESLSQGNKPHPPETYSPKAVSNRSPIHPKINSYVTGCPGAAMLPSQTVFQISPDGFFGSVDQLTDGGYDHAAGKHAQEVDSQNKQ